MECGAGAVSLSTEQAASLQVLSRLWVHRLKVCLCEQAALCLCCFWNQGLGSRTWLSK